MNLTTFSTSHEDMSGSVDDSTISPFSVVFIGLVTLPFMSDLYNVWVVVLFGVVVESESQEDLHTGATIVVATVTGDPDMSLNILAELGVGEGSSSSELLPPSPFRFLVGADRSNALES